MVATVHNIGEARRRREERGEVMHFSSSRGHLPSDFCPMCRVCELCGAGACNDPEIKEFLNENAEFAQKWTDDYHVFLLHINPCTRLPVIGRPDE